MGPARSSRTNTRTTIKGYDDQQQHRDPSSSSKVKVKRRKMTDFDPKWSTDELTHFYEAYRRHGKDWKKISAVVGGKSSDMVEALYSTHRNFLSLPERQATAMGFVALVTGHGNVLEESTSHRGDQTVRASGKRRKRGEATQQRVNEGSHAHHSCLEGKISGFSSSFRQRYYGELLRSSPSQATGKRTPRIPVMAPADRNAADDATPEIKSATSSAKKNNEEINKDRTNFPLNECSPDGSSGITEANKVEQGQNLLDTRGTGDAEICQSQQLLKRRRIHQTMDKVQTGKVEHETMVAVEEGNMLVDSRDQHQILPEFISEDDMLVLDVLQSLVDAPSKMSKLKINNIPSGSHGKIDSALPRGRKVQRSPVDLSEQGKPVAESSASKTKQKRRKKLSDAEVLVEEPKVSVNNIVLPEPHRIGITEDSSLCSDSGRGQADLPESTANMSAEVYPNAPTEMKPELSISRRSKRKAEMHCKTKNVSCNEGSNSLQARKLQHCLSSESLRRWCTYEWFYSAVDYPWFMDNEFVHYLNFANWSHLSRLTRSEWSTIRSSLGKPRRFSDNFLAAEREKLADYRKQVREYYAQLIDGSRDSLPADLARPFSIGQKVIVRHPSTRELCDGKVVMIGQDCYKVQFDIPGLGSDLVKDTDCMPVNWLDNINLIDDTRRRFLSNNLYKRLEIERVPKLTPNGNWNHTIQGVPVPERPNVQITSGKQLKNEYAVHSERLPKKGTSDGMVQSRICPNNVGHDDELESYITAFVEMSVSQASRMVDETMQAISEGYDSRDEEAGTPNQATSCLGQECGAAELPSNLIVNCVATILSIKRLSDSRHPPANIAGVLERASAMLRPICSENFAIYKDIESSLGIIANQILALVPTTLGNGGAAVLPM
ncbi:hypothetical protein ACP70R_030631 [Stipagrostis hirtigluma subsp. patula]